MLPLWTKRDALAVVLDCVPNRRVNQTLGTQIAHGFDTDADLKADLTMRCPDPFQILLPLLRCIQGAEPNLLEILGKFLGDEIQNLRRLGTPALVFNPRINVFCVLAEDHHVHLFRMLHRARHTREILHRPQTHIKVQHLPQRDIQGSNPTTHRRRQRPLDSHQKFPKRFHRIVRQPRLRIPLGGPGLKLIKRLLPRKNFHPRNLLLPPKRLRHRRIKNPHARPPDIRPRPVPFDERNNRMVRHIQPAPSHRDRSPIRRNSYRLK